MYVTPLSILVAWFVAALLTSFSGVVDRVPSAILLSTSFVLALAAYLALYFALPIFRQFVLARSARFLTLAEVPRLTGFIFFIGYAQGVLPALYAFATGTSDIAFGLTALLLSRSTPSSSLTRRVLLWHCAGILGLIISGLSGILTSPSVVGSEQRPITSQAMSTFPWNLVPLFLGPLMLWFHLMAICKYNNR